MYLIFQNKYIVPFISTTVFQFFIWFIFIIPANASSYVNCLNLEDYTIDQLFQSDVVFLGQIVKSQNTLPFRVKFRDIDGLKYTYAYVDLMSVEIEKVIKGSNLAINSVKTVAYYNICNDCADKKFRDGIKTFVSEENSELRLFIINSKSKGIIISKPKNIKQNIDKADFLTGKCGIQVFNSKIEASPLGQFILDAPNEPRKY